MIEKLLSPETYSVMGQWAMGFCKNLVVALVVYFIGKYIIKWITKIVLKKMGHMHHPSFRDQNKNIPRLPQ